MRPGRAPRARAACTNSVSRSDKAMPRASRARPTHEVKLMPAMMNSMPPMARSTDTTARTSALGSSRWPKPSLNTTSSRMMNSRLGNAYSVSTTRIIALSTRPPA